MSKVRGGLGKWFRQKWVDVSRKTKSGKHPKCGASAGSKSRAGGKRAYPKCVPASKAASMSKKDKESATRRKRAAYKSKKGAPAKKPKMVKTELIEKLQTLIEKNVPNDPGKWAASIAKAKRKFKVYPSAYANAFAAKDYKAKGGTWRAKKESVNEGYSKHSSYDEVIKAIQDFAKKKGYKIPSKGMKLITMNPPSEPKYGFNRGTTIPLDKKVNLDFDIHGVGKVFTLNQSLKLNKTFAEGDMDVSSLNLHRTSMGFGDREKLIGYRWKDFQKNYLKLNPKYRIANANDRVYGYKLGDGDAHWMYDPNDGEIYIDDKMVARKVMTGRADKKIFESLWANINKKKKRGEKSARKGSKAYKAAVKAGNKLKKGKSESVLYRFDEGVEIVEHSEPFLYQEAEYQGRTVKLNKPMQGDVKKFKVYVKNEKGNVVKVNFGQKGMNIKKNNPERRKSFRARHNCDNPGPKTKARYWSCRKW